MAASAFTVSFLRAGHRAVSETQHVVNGRWWIKYSLLNFPLKPALPKTPAEPFLKRVLCGLQLHHSLVLAMKGNSMYLKILIF